MLQYKMRCKKSFNPSVQTHIPKAAERKIHSKHADLCALDLIGLIKCFSWKCFPLITLLYNFYAIWKMLLQLFVVLLYMNDFGQFWCYLRHRIYYWFEKHWWGTFFFTNFYFIFKWMINIESKWQWKRNFYRTMWEHGKKKHGANKC